MIAVYLWAGFTIIMAAWLAYDIFKNRNVGHVYYDPNSDSIYLSKYPPNKSIFSELNCTYLGPL